MTAVELSPLFNYTKLKQYSRQSKRFKRREVITEFMLTHNISDYDNIAIITSEIDDVFTQIFNEVTEGVNENNLMSAYLTHNELSYNIFVSPQKISQFKIDRFLNSIEKV